MKEWFRFVDPLREKFKSLVSDKKTLLLICGCAAGFLLLLILLVISLGMNHNQGEMSQNSAELRQLLAPQAIKSEDLFLPAEPDFLPEVMLDREPRDSWTEKDAEQFWTDPLDGNTEVWKHRIIKAVDDLLENIP